MLLRLICFVSILLLSFGTSRILADFELFVVPGDTPDLNDEFQSYLGEGSSLDTFDEYAHLQVVTQISTADVFTVSGETSEASAVAAISGVFNIDEVMLNGTLHNGRINNVWQAVTEFRFTEDVNAFGFWIFDDHGSGGDKYRIGVEDAGGAVTYSDFLDRGTFQVEGFLGVVSDSTLVRVWVEAHQLTSTPEAPLLSLSPGYEMDYVQSGVQKVGMGKSAYRPIATVDHVVLESLESGNQLLSLEFESLEISLDNEYLIQVSANLVDWLNLDPGFTIESGRVRADLEINTDPGGLFFRLVEFDYVELSEDEIDQLEDSISLLLDTFAGNLKDQMIGDENFADLAELPMALLEVMSALFSSLSSEEQDAVIEALFNAGVINELNQVAQLEPPESEAVSPKLFARNGNLTSENHAKLVVNDPRWSEVQLARGYVAHSKALDIMSFTSTAMSLAKKGNLLGDLASRANIYAKLISYMIKIGDFFAKGYYPSVPTELKISSQGGILDPLEFGNEPYPYVRFYVDFESLSSVYVQGLKILSSELLSKYSKELSTIKSIKSLIEKGASLGLWNIEEETQAVQDSIDEVAALAPESFTAVASYVEELIARLQGLGKSQYVDVEVNPYALGIQPYYFLEPPTKTLPVAWDTTSGSSEIQPKNIKITGSGWIGFYFNDPLYRGIHLETDEEDEIYFHVPNEAPEFVGISGWLGDSMANYSARLFTNDKEMDDIIVESAKADYGDISWDPSTQRIAYTLNQNAKILFSTSTSSATTDKPFQIIVTDEEPTTFNALLKFDSNQTDTIEFTYRDEFNDPVLQTVEINIGELIFDAISSGEFDLVDDPATIGQPSDPPFFDYLSGVGKGNLFKTAGEVSQTFVLQQKSGVQPPETGGWGLWFEVDLEVFQLQQVVGVIPQVGDELPPVINSLAETDEYRKDLYTIQLDAEDSKSDITHYFYEIVGALDESSATPASEDPNWLPLPAEAISNNVNAVIELKQDDPFFQPPLGKFEDWFLNVWVRDSEGNVSFGSTLLLPWAQPFSDEEIRAHFVGKWDIWEDLFCTCWNSPMIGEGFEKVTTYGVDYYLGSSSSVKCDELLGLSVDYIVRPASNPWYQLELFGDGTGHFSFYQTGTSELGEGFREITWTVENGKITFPLNVGLPGEGFLRVSGYVEVLAGLYNNQEFLNYNTALRDDWCEGSFMRVVKAP